MKKIAFLFLMMAFTSSLLGQKNDNFPPPDDPIVVEAVQTTEEIHIDGNLEEASWQQAQVIQDFFRREPRQGGPILYKTEVRLLYDQKYLYVGAICHDSLGIKGIRVQDLRRDFEWGENDIFGISLDPQNLKQYAQAFMTTPYGNQRDLQNFNGNTFDTGWNTLWKVRSQRSSEGYVVEFAIPFKSLRYDLPEEGQAVEWGLTFIRYARREVEVSSFPAIPQAFTPYRMTYAAKLKGIEVPKPAANIRVEPYGLFQYEAGGAAGEANRQAKAGLDVKWAINPHTVLDLTVNTDFAQAEVDRAVNNLERFNIFFPERRQFFLENSGIWAGGKQQAIRPFFSRRIGLEGEFNAAPAPIDVGARFTQRTDKQALAALFVRQRATANSPGANFGVLRYLRNYGRENNVGVMLTQRVDDANSGGSLSGLSNTTLTIDGQIRPSSQWDIQYLLSTSIDERTGETGFAGRIFAGQQSNAFYYGWVTEYTDDAYTPRMGFIRQQNVIRHNPGGYYIWRPKKMNWIRRWDPGTFVNLNHDALDPARFQQASLYIFPIYTWFKDNSFVEVSLTPTWQNINFSFAPLGLPIDQGSYFYTRYLLKYNTDQSKKWALSASYNFGKFYNGQRNTIKGAARFAPLPHLALSFDYEYNALQNIGLNEADLQVNLYSANLRVALNPRVQLSTFYQYNSLTRQGRWNMRFSWEYLPLSFLYVVFNDTQIDALLEPAHDQQLIGKLTLVHQF
ncbi:MAG: DUF5916 domain-containing protein [Bacteroidota bacterium]